MNIVAKKIVLRTRRQVFGEMLGNYGFSFGRVKGFGGFPGGYEKYFVLGIDCFGKLIGNQRQNLENFFEFLEEEEGKFNLLVGSSTNGWRVLLFLGPSFPKGGFFWLEFWGIPWGFSCCYKLGPF